MPRPSSAISPTLPLAELQRFSPLIGDDVFAVLTLEGSVASRNHPGGTAPAQVRAAIRAARVARSNRRGALTASHRAAPAPISTSKEQRWTAANSHFSAWASWAIRWPDIWRAPDIAVTVYNRTPAKAAQWVAKYGGTTRADAGGGGRAAPSS